MWEYERHGDYTWLFAGDNVINIRQVRRFSLYRNSAAGDKLTVFYIDGSSDYFVGVDCKNIWKSLVKASEAMNVKP